MLPGPSVFFYMILEIGDRRNDRTIEEGETPGTKKENTRSKNVPLRGNSKRVVTDSFTKTKKTSELSLPDSQEWRRVVRQ